MTFYPHAGTGSNGIDGQIYGMGPEDNGYSWSQIWSGSCTISPDPSSNIASVYLRKCADNSGWCVLGRSITGFDTSSLPPGAVITSATLSIYGALKCMGGSYAPSINVYSASPASNTNLTNSDYLCLGSTPDCSTPISYTNFSVTGYNDFVLNAAGLSAINKNGVTNFGWREVGSDVANTPQDCVYSPPSVLRFYTADQGGGYAPKLVINYTMGNYSVHLDEIDETTYGSSGSQTARSLYIYDSYGNVATSYQGNPNVTTDNTTTNYVYTYNTNANILDKVAHEWVTDYQGNTKQETFDYYDMNNSSYTTSPTKGNLTRVQQSANVSSNVSTYNTYDGYGNKLSSINANGNTTNWTYETLTTPTL